MSVKFWVHVRRSPIKEGFYLRSSYFGPLHSREEELRKNDAIAVIISCRPARHKSFSKKTSRQSVQAFYLMTVKVATLWLTVRDDCC